MGILTIIYPKILELEQKFIVLPSFTSMAQGSTPSPWDRRSVC